MTQSTPTIRHATLDDAQAIAELHVRAWQWAYQGLMPADYLASLDGMIPERIERRISQLRDLPPHVRWWLAELDGQLLGFAMTGPSRDSDVTPETVEVYAIYLAQEAAGKGVGRALFAHAVDDLRQRGFNQATLWVLDTNQRARRFYEAAGWTPDGTSKIDDSHPGTTLHEVRYRITLR